MMMDVDVDVDVMLMLMLMLMLKVACCIWCGQPCAYQYAYLFDFRKRQMRTGLCQATKLVHASDWSTPISLLL